MSRRPKHHPKWLKQIHKYNSKITHMLINNTMPDMTVVIDQQSNLRIYNRSKLAQISACACREIQIA